MSLLGSLAAQGLTQALGFALRASPVDISSIATVMSLTGKALIDLAGKVKDGKISEAEVEDTLQKIGAAENEPVALAAKAAVGRIIEQIL